MKARHYIKFKGEWTRSNLFESNHGPPVYFPDGVVSVYDGAFGTVLYGNRADTSEFVKSECGKEYEGKARFLPYGQEGPERSALVTEENSFRVGL